MNNSNEDLKAKIQLLEEPTEHYRHSVINRINSFLDLEENWDSYGAKVIEKSTVDRAIEFYANLMTVTPHLHEPFVSPDCNGNIDFHWEGQSDFFCSIPEEDKGVYEVLIQDKQFGYAIGIPELIKIIASWIGRPQ
jgi:hypothetical protein